jgi:hypothetical protein
MLATSPPVIGGSSNYSVFEAERLLNVRTISSSGLENCGG